MMDKHYDRKYQDMHDRLDNLYDKISEHEDSIADITARIEAVYTRLQENRFMTFWYILK